MFSSLENTSVALWVGQSLWAYPGLLSIHIIGLSIVVGVFSMRDLRLLGLFRSIDASAFRSISTLGAFGFVINAVSGFLLFSSQASYFIESSPFLIKISCIVIGMCLAVILQLRLKKSVTLGPSSLEGKNTKILAALSLTTWVCAIAAGRLIAYL